MSVLANVFDGRVSKITLATVKQQHLKMDNDECVVMDLIDVLQSLLLKQLPSERINGVINLLYVLAGGGSEHDLANALVRWTKDTDCHLMPLSKLQLHFFRDICMALTHVQ